MAKLIEHKINLLFKDFLKKLRTISGAVSSVLLEIAYLLAKYPLFARRIAKTKGIFPPQKIRTHLLNSIKYF